MDKRATQGRTGTVHAHPAIAAEEKAQNVEIAGASIDDRADLRDVLNAIAARIDVLLDEKVATGSEPVDRHRSVQAWSSVVGGHASDEASGLRRRALATTVLRMSADGRVDVDDGKARAIDDVAQGAGYGAADGVAESDTEDAADGAAASIDAADRQPDVERSGAEERLSAARRRLAARRANATAARVDAAGPREPHVLARVWQRIDARTLIQRLLIGLAIIGASAVVSILIS